jgi:hypothetical protein
MSSTNPSDEAWRSLLISFSDLGNPGTPALSATSTPSSGTSGTSGEFNPFTVIGSVASGGAKRKLVEGSGDPNSACFGLVGRHKFCIRDRINERSCGKGTHGTVKFTSSSAHLYIRAAAHEVYCQPVIPPDMFNETQLGEVFAQSFTGSDWVKIFSDKVKGVNPSWLSASAERKPAAAVTSEVGAASLALLPLLSPLHLLSPLRSEERTGIFKVSPTLSFESTDSENSTEDHDGEWKSRVTPAEFFPYVECIRG